MKKTLNTIQWAFVDKFQSIMVKLRASRYMCQRNDWVLKSSTSSCILDVALTILWDLAQSIKQGCCISALLYLSATYQQLMYNNTIMSTTELHV